MVGAMPGRKHQGRTRRASGPPLRASAGRRPPAATRSKAGAARRRTRGAAPSRPAAPLGRADLGVAAGVGAAACLVFCSTFSSHVALGDAPESVTGTRSLGILHAPGYAMYALAAHVFAEIMRVGSWEFRVNLFSLVCAALCVAVVYLLARVLGADRIGAAIGALALATAVSFWFNADFAKYYAFSGFLIAIIAFCVVWWQLSGRDRYLVIAGILVGSSVGVSWQLTVIVTAGLIAMLWVGSPRPKLAVTVGAGTAALVTAVGVCVYIVVRAHQDPVMNYGDAISVGRLYELLSAGDYQGNRQAAGTGLGHLAGGGFTYIAIVVRDIGLGAVALAAVGIFDVSDRRRLDHGLFFAFAGLGNIVAVGLVSGFSQILGFYTGLVVGGQLIGALIVIALLAALGTTRLLYELDEWQADAHRTRSRGAVTPGRVRVAAAAIIVLVAVVPSLIVHYQNADHRIAPLADRYALRVLASLPPRSVLLTGGWEYGQPIVERQLLHHDRPDVVVVSADAIPFTWYRDEMVHRLGLDSSLITATSENAVTRFVSALRQRRPVFADAQAMLDEGGLFGYQPEGLVARVVSGTGPQPSTTFVADAAALQRGEVQDGITGLSYDRWPNYAMYFFYERAHVELAKEFALHNELDQAATELERALVFGPKNEDRSPITAAREHQPDAKQIILGL
jgi:hypothetical protein